MVDAIRCDRVIRNILQIRIPEVQNCIMHRRGDAANDRMLHYLYLEQSIEELLVVHTQFIEVTEYILDESLQPFWRDDRRDNRT